MRVRLIFVLLAVGPLFLPAALAGKPPPTASVLVDCTDPDPKKHGSINAALQTPAEELTVEIRGICVEDVVIARGNVILRGADRMTDGVRGARAVPDPAVYNAVILVDEAHLVRLEEMAVLGGIRGGVWVDGGGVVLITDCRILDHGTYAVSAWDTLFLGVYGTVITGAGRTGLITSDVINTRCFDCVIEGAQAGVNPSLSGYMLITDSSITSATTGVLSDLGGWISLVNTDVDAPNVLQALRSDIHMRGGTLGDGYIWGAQKSSISLTDVTQTTNTLGSHGMNSDSLLRLSGATSLVGWPNLRGFSKLWVEGASTVDGGLSCESGSDAYCDDPATNVTGTSNCGSCPKP